MTRMPKNVCEDEATAPTTRVCCSCPICSSSVEREFDLERRTRVNIGEGFKFVYWTCPGCTHVQGFSQESDLEQHVRAVHLGARLSCPHVWVDASGNLYECAHTYSDPSNLNLIRHRSLMYDFEAEIQVPTLVGTMVYPEHLHFRVAGANLAPCPLMAPLDAAPVVVVVRHAFDLSVPLPSPSPSPAIQLTYASGTLATTARTGISASNISPAPNAHWQAAAVDLNGSRWTFTGGSPITTDLHFTFSASAASSFSHESISISFFPPPRNGNGNGHGNGNCSGNPNCGGGAPNHNCNTLVLPGTRASATGTVEQANILASADAALSAPTLGMGMGMGMDAGSWSESESSLSESEWVEMFMAIAPHEVLREYYGLG